MPLLINEIDGMVTGAQAVGKEDFPGELPGLSEWNADFPTIEPSYTLLLTPLEHCPAPGHPPLLRAGELASLLTPVSLPLASVWTPGAHLARNTATTGQI